MKMVMNRHKINFRSVRQVLYKWYIQKKGVNMCYGDSDYKEMDAQLKKLGQ